MLFVVVGSGCAAVSDHAIVISVACVSRLWADMHKGQCSKAFGRYRKSGPLIHTTLLYNKIGSGSRLFWPSEFPVPAVHEAEPLVFTGATYPAYASQVILPTASQHHHLHVMSHD